MLRSLFARRKKTKSLLQVLSTFVSTKDLEHAISDITDWRELVTKVAEIKKMSEEKCLEKIAVKLKIPYTLSVPACDVSALPANVKLSDFRRAGSIPFTVKGKLSGIVCIDPSSIEKLDPKLLKIPLYYSTWKSIQVALDQSEKIFLKSHPDGIEEPVVSEEQVSRPNPLESASKDIVSMLIKEVSSYNGNSVLLTFDSEKIDYSFISFEGRKGNGSIHPRISTHLLRYLKTIQSHGGNFVHLAQDGAEYNLMTEFLPGNLLQVKLRWRGADKKAPVVPSESTDLSPQILIVEDNDTFAKVLERFFELKGFDTIRFHNGEEALDYLETATNKPVICICDLHMPRMNGITFLQNLRMNNELRAIPVIILTSDEDSEVELEVLSVGAAAFISKNEDPKVLLAHVESLMDKQDKRIAQ